MSFRQSKIAMPKFSSVSVMVYVDLLRRQIGSKLILAVSKTKLEN